MEFIIDTVNLEEIKEAVEYLPIVGVTSNPSIVKKTNPQDFFKHMKEIRKIIGQERSLHIQVISKDCDTIIKEAAFKTLHHFSYSYSYTQSSPPKDNAMLSVYHYCICCSIPLNSLSQFDQKHP